MREQILALLEEAADGMTSKDLAILMRCPRAVVARRLAEMKSDGLIEGGGEYRADAAVVIVAPQRCLLAAGSGMASLEASR